MNEVEQPAWESELGIEFRGVLRAKPRAVKDCIVGAVLEVMGPRVTVACFRCCCQNFGFKAGSWIESNAESFCDSCFTAAERCVAEASVC